MKKKQKKTALIGLGFISAFVIWTVLLLLIDVRPIGPQGSSVGFSALNSFVHQLTGVNMLLYTVTDWLGLVPIAVAFGFAILGLCQWIRRKSLLRTDRNVLALGVFYIAVLAIYALFEFAVINYRPVLIEGILEASYPSSTTVLVTCVMPTAMMQLNFRIKSKAVRLLVNLASGAFIAFMVIGRLFSGVHWFTDIIGGTLVSTGLVLLYASYFYSNQ